MARVLIGGRRGVAVRAVVTVTVTDIDLTPVRSRPPTRHPPEQPASQPVGRRGRRSPPSTGAALAGGVQFVGDGGAEFVPAVLELG